MRIQCAQRLSGEWVCRTQCKSHLNSLLRIARVKGNLCSSCKAAAFSVETEGNEDSTSSLGCAKAGGGLTVLIQRLSLE